MKYKLRAECIADVIKLMENTRLESYKIISADARIPDVEFEFSVMLDLREIKNILLGIQDTHVMRETVAQFEEYTGERKQ